MSARLRAEGRRFPILAARRRRQPYRRPAGAGGQPPGTIQPAGGLDHGHKGYALALMVEALTMGLGGFGRAEPAEGWGASVFVQLLDPDAFAGAAAFRRQTAWIADACRASATRPGVERVRLPGESALARRTQALAEGVELYPGIMERLSSHAKRLGLER